MGFDETFTVKEKKEDLPPTELAEKAYCFAPGIDRWAKKP